MFMTEPGLVFSKKFHTNKKVGTVISESLDIAKLCSTPLKQVPGKWDNIKLSGIEMPKKE